MQRGYSTLFCGCFKSKRGFQIELARESDQAEIREVAEQSSEEVYQEPYDVRKRPALFKEFGQKNAVFLTARLNGKMIGYAKILIHETNDGVKNAFLAKLYFLQAYCRQGYGTQMMQRCLQEAVDRGANMMYLYVWTKNEAAIKFYQKFHFHFGPLMPTYLVDGIELSGENTADMRCENIKNLLRHSQVMKPQK